MGVLKTAKPLVRNQLLAAVNKLQGIIHPSTRFVSNPEPIQPEASFTLKATDQVTAIRDQFHIDD